MLANLWLHCALEQLPRSESALSSSTLWNRLQSKRSQGRASCRTARQMISPCLRVIPSHRITTTLPFPSRCWNWISITIIVSWKGGELDFSREEDAVYVI